MIDHHREISVKTDADGATVNKSVLGRKKNTSLGDAREVLKGTLNDI